MHLCRLYSEVNEDIHDIIPLKCLHLNKSLIYYKCENVAQDLCKRKEKDQVQKVVIKVRKPLKSSKQPGQ